MQTLLKIVHIPFNLCVTGSDSASEALQAFPGQQHIPSFGWRENSILHRFSSDTKVFPSAWLNFSSARFALENAAKQTELGFRAKRGGREVWRQGTRAANFKPGVTFVLYPSVSPGPPGTRHSRCLRTSCSSLQTLDHSSLIT